MKKHSVTMTPLKDKKKWLIKKVTPEDFERKVSIKTPFSLKYYIFPYLASHFGAADEITITAKYKEAGDKPKIKKKVK